ncbi:hypothetical protein AAFF_G00114620 [Aldrovandia affinis]|uniref:Claudin n=1 Tax=Aldrovandia affinis TaxID=143900 RepID=A0AAD7WAB6_9TELE|nr:hypothetical protein AAFF_G00114620 [Aldrovandia affinis]
MSYWEVVMYAEIGCFVLCVSGWVLVCSTMPTESWTFHTLDGVVLTTPIYFSNLWKDCLTDSTGVSDCKEFPSLLALNHSRVGTRAMCFNSRGWQLPSQAHRRPVTKKGDPPNSGSLPYGLAPGIRRLAQRGKWSLLGLWTWS